jgi:3-deoxy-7-phosphoheptulonate synthase
MIVIMAREATEMQIERVTIHIHEEGLESHVSRGVERTVIGVIGTAISEEVRSRLEAMEGVESVVRVNKPYKFTARESVAGMSRVRVNGTVIGGSAVVVMAGPCSVESREQLLTTAHGVHQAGAVILRGGAFKPRTSPYSFQGLGREALELLVAAKRETGMPIITELMDVDALDVVVEHADILQIGARNMQNFALLRAVGQVRKPVMLKRGPGCTIDEWLNSAEYICAGGNHQVMLCERGIRTFETETRFTMDVSAVPVLKHLTHLPVIVDPSHAAGKRAYVKALALAGIAAGADGIIVEVHPQPEKALSDGAQSLTIPEFHDLMDAVRRVAEAVGREVAAAHALAVR